MKTAPDDDASTLFYQPTDTTKRPRALRRFTVVRYGPRVSVPRRDEEPVVMDVEAGLLQHRRQLGLSGPGRRVMGHMADKLERDRAIPKFHCGGERVQTSARSKDEERSLATSQWSTSPHSRRKGSSLRLGCPSSAASQEFGCLSGRSPFFELHE